MWTSVQNNYIYYNANLVKYKFAIQDPSNMGILRSVLCYEGGRDRGALNQACGSCHFVGENTEMDMSKRFAGRVR